MRSVIIKYILVTGVCLVLGSCKFAEDSIWLIPEGYVGPVIIIFNQPEGAPKKYENGKRVYEIPENGILRTRFGPNNGIQKHWYFYVNADGNRTPIEYIDQWEINERKYSPEKVYAFDEGAGAIGSANHDFIHFKKSFVGKPSNRDSLQMVMKSIKIE